VDRWVVGELHVDEFDDAGYLLSGATLAGESVGPVFAPASQAHVMARTAIAGIGGTVRILRSAAGGWVEIARYTDTGRYRMPGALGLDWAAAAAG
jgi:hypothetical protein